MATKKLYRSDTDRIVAGIIGGIGEYLDIDSTVLRLIWLIVLIFSGIIPGLIVYILALFIIPRKQVDKAPLQNVIEMEEKKTDSSANEW